jgi:hypothetical protein
VHELKGKYHTWALRQQRDAGIIEMIFCFAFVRSRNCLVEAVLFNKLLILITRKNLTFVYKISLDTQLSSTFTVPRFFGANI